MIFKKERKALQAASLGIYIASCVIIGTIGGNWIDSKIGTSPLFLFLGTAAGVTASGIEIWKVVKKSMK